MVPSVNKSFGPGSLEKMLDGMGDSSLRKLVQNNSRTGARPLSSYNAPGGALVAHRSARSSA